MPTLAFGLELAFGDSNMLAPLSSPSWIVEFSPTLMPAPPLS
jgi:hypothetical protein